MKMSDIISQLLSSIHKNEFLRDWITIESVPLKPWIYHKNDITEIHILVASPVPQKDGYCVWGHIVWQLNSLAIIKKEYLKNKKIMEFYKCESEKEVFFYSDSRRV